ncbi:MAG: ABC transporter substrate-binding protein [Thermoplasmata archaeon]
MNKKALYALIAVIVVIILVVAVLEVLPSSSASLSVSTSSSNATVGQSITYYAFISGGTPSSMVFNFGDGATGTATHLSGNEYTVTHSYSSPGKYLVTATATVNGKTLDNMQSIDEITVIPASVNPTLATEITEPTVIIPTQIISPGSSIRLTASTLQPPSATNWTIGYYVWNYGDGATSTNYTVFNTSSGNFMAGTVAHTYSKAGIYTVTLGVITFNTTNYVPSTYTSNGINYTYYPVSDLTSILSSGQYQNTTYLTTIVVNSTAKLQTSTAPVTNPNEIIVTEVQPGGAYSFDPPLDYEVVGDEVIVNVYEQLVQYNGSSTSQLFPMVASEIPTIANGGISSNYLNYTFHIRTGLKFSNGDPLTAWDVYASIVRSLLFVQGSPGTPDWIIAQDLLPGGGYATGLYTNGTALYDNITNAITVNNATQTVTFHLLKIDPAFLDYLANPQCAAIMDYSWLVSHGAGITFTPAGFLAYTSEGNEVNFNNYIRYNTMGSGPYMIKSYLIGQSVSLAPNPYYTPIPGVPGFDHAANDTIYIQWEKDTSTALLIAETGQTDVVDGLPNNDYIILEHLATEGKLKITTFPTIGIYYFTFNWDINTTMMQIEFGSQYHVPAHYFANQMVRKAFAYAFNDTNYLNNIFGNDIYGEDFGFAYAGVIPNGMPGYVPISKEQNVPYFNITLAKQYMMDSGLYNTSVNLPLVVFAGDPIDFAAAGMWAQSIELMDPNIQVTPEYVLGNAVMGDMYPGQNPLPIYMLTWFPDFPYPSDYINSLYLQGGWNPLGNSWNYTNLVSWGYGQEAQEFQNMTNLILKADNEGNETLALQYFDQAQQIAINMSLLVYTVDLTGHWVYSPVLQGFSNEENPMYASGGDLLYIYLSK